MRIMSIGNQSQIRSSNTQQPNYVMKSNTSRVSFGNKNEDIVEGTLDFIKLGLGLLEKKGENLLEFRINKGGKKDYNAGLQLTNPGEILVIEKKKGKCFVGYGYRKRDNDSNYSVYMEHLMTPTTWKDDNELTHTEALRWNAKIRQIVTDICKQEGIQPPTPKKVKKIEERN